MDVSRWNQNFEEIRCYLEEHNCTLADIPKSVRADSTGTVMKIWIMEMRKAYRDCASSNFHLNDAQKEKLRSIGMEEWINLPEREWLAHLTDVKAFYEKHHTFSVPDGTKSGNLNLHTWMVKQRADFRNGTMSEKRLQKIQELNMMEMLSTRDVPFQNGYQHAKEFYEKNHHLLVPENFLCEDGYPLGEWLCAVKYEFSGNRLSPTRIRKLNRIGMVWNIC